MKAHLKRLLAVEDVALSKELAEALRHRELTWALIPPLMRKLTLPFLTLKETLTLDTAVSERGEDDERDHLIKAYVGLRSPGFDEWVFKGTKTRGFVGEKERHRPAAPEAGVPGRERGQGARAAGIGRE